MHRLLVAALLALLVAAAPAEGCQCITGLYVGDRFYEEVSRTFEGRAGGRIAVVHPSCCGLTETRRGTARTIQGLPQTVAVTTGGGV